MGIKYMHVLNNYSRNIKASGSHHLADEQKIRVINMLKKKGFPVAKIKNPALRVAFSVEVTPHLFQRMIESTTPKQKESSAESGGNSSNVASGSKAKYFSPDDESDMGEYVMWELKKYS